jgi:adenine-specific DNA-methyltransferase
MVTRHPYLTSQVIAYIGNKRALLPFLSRAFGRLTEGRSGLVFSDAFAGSGVVSRLARLMGFRVLSNDWEPYSFAINSCYLGVPASELPLLFRGRGGLPAVLAELNALPPPREEERYISRHYAPRATRTADWRTERLFYTAENAAVIDAVRTRIESMYPGTLAGETERREKAVLLGPLLYEASTHTNTSGVFKACHKGFGGHGGDALTRIMAPITLRPPVLVDTPFASQVFCDDAAAFAAAHGADICYVDPPYASHQYGSNYFMLTSIALWDRPAVSAERAPDGGFAARAGIRPDWVRTRSPFCSRTAAPAAFRRLLSAADCRWLCVSYSDEGLVGPEELADILAEGGSLSILTTEHVKYPGGRQSPRRTGRNLEMLFVVERGGKHGRPAAPAGGDRIRRILAESRLSKLLGGTFHPGRVRAAFRTEGDCILVGGRRLPMNGFHRFVDGGAAAAGLGARERARLLEALGECLTADRREEITVLLGVLAGEKDPAARAALLREVLRLVRKLAHRSHRELFEETMAELRGLVREGRAGLPFEQGLALVEAAAARRFAGVR